jgi:SAM-dependent methyltransferase
MSESRNLEQKELWGDNSPPDISAVFRACLGYASCPGWVFIRQTIIEIFGTFKGLRTIELGSGDGKVSLLFSLLGAKTTLVDYSSKQLKRAKFIAQKFEVEPLIVEENILELPKSFLGQYDISMSFGTVEHFFGTDRQKVFHAHFRVLRNGGVSIIWVPNRYGLLFHVGVALRRLFRRNSSMIDEIPFTRKELVYRAKKAGLTDIKIIGAELLTNDFCNFILDVPRLLGSTKSRKTFVNAEKTTNELLACMRRNKLSLRPWNDLFSYPLMLIGKY